METSLTSERIDIRIQHKQLPVQVVCKELIWTVIMDTCSHTMTWARLDRQVYVQMTTEDRVRFLSQKLQRSKALWQVGQTFLLR
jgi:hypothetical protein